MAANDVYDHLKAMAVGFRLRPGDRLNEGALARQLGVSRTPLRESLNRLVAERFFDFTPGIGFFCRALDTQSVFDLYELRGILESSAIRLAIARATDAGIASVKADLYATGLEVSGLSIAEACARDEAFHIAIARLSGNSEVLDQLTRVNERIRYIRWVQMSRERALKSKDEHRAIMAALESRDEARAVAALGSHIERRMDQITAAVSKGISSIYMGGETRLSDRLVAEVSQ